MQNELHAILSFLLDQVLNLTRLFSSVFSQEYNPPILHDGVKDHLIKENMYREYQSHKKILRL